ncbi:MAG: hypothetical protein LUG89_02830 [Methanosphaera sp.]|nr:hypothetical protein [Methanosphaera sp.]
MDLAWFYIAVVLACSDILHGFIWHTFSDFYIILGERIYKTVNSSFITWIIHELLEAIFHVVVLSIVFMSPTIGILAGTIHFIIDIIHNYYDIEMPEYVHRALHFTIESIFFMIVLAL